MEEQKEIPIKENLKKFQYSLTQLEKVLGRTCAIMLICSKFYPTMNEKQKETFEQQLDRSEETIEKAIKIIKELNKLKK